MCIELSQMLHRSHLLVSAMAHFISQLQYYIAFEVCNYTGHTCCMLLPSHCLDVCTENASYNVLCFLRALYACSGNVSLPHMYVANCAHHPLPFPYWSLVLVVRQYLLQFYLEHT